eukprot:scaffold1800_cov387-Prasinococcus_capsulatus_cf.AAC.13
MGTGSPHARVRVSHRWPAAAQAEQAPCPPSPCWQSPLADALADEATRVWVATCTSTCSPTASGVEGAV